jgi:hypothetical protein
VCCTGPALPRHDLGRVGLGLLHRAPRRVGDRRRPPRAPVPGAHAPVPGGVLPAQPGRDHPRPARRPRRADRLQSADAVGVAGHRPGGAPLRRRLGRAPRDPHARAGPAAPTRVQRGRIGRDAPGRRRLPVRAPRDHRLQQGPGALDAGTARAPRTAVGVAARGRRPLVRRPDRACAAGHRAAPARGRAAELSAGPRDAALLGGTVIGLLGWEQGAQAAARFACGLHPQGPRAALSQAFGGRSLAHTEGAWRSHLSRLAGAQ